MKILAYIAGFDGCGLFRLQLPFKYLNRIPEVSTKISFKYDAEDLQWADVVIFQKQYQDAVLPYMEMAQKMGKPVVLEMDDLMTEIPEWNAAHDFYKHKKDKIVNFIQKVDACTVSTEYLKEVNSGLNPNIFMLPNSMDFEQLASYRRKQPEYFHRHLVFKNPQSLISRAKVQDVLPRAEVLKKLQGRLKIMWWGSPTHSQDLNVIDKTLATLAHEYPDLLVLKFGCCTAEFLDHMKGNLEQLIIMDPVQVHNFHGALQAVAELGPTISVCPIVDLPFNRAKSNLKVIESFSMKMAVVASKVENYTKTITHGVNGYLSDNRINADGIAEDWYKNIKLLIQDPVEREYISENGHTTGYKEYNMATNAKLWMDAYTTILGQG